jgi:hypothetical protein
MNAVRAGLCLGTASIMSLALSVAEAEVIFSDNFDAQPDFTASVSGRQSADEGDILPEGWTHLHSASKWNPGSGYPTKHESLEILAANSDKARGGTGKSIVNWRESWTPDSGWKFWNSDSQLIKLLDNSYNELYIEFYIRFSDNWFQRIRPGNSSSYTSKLFRVGHFNGGVNIFNGAKGDIGPIFFWDYKRDNYGIRNIHAYRGNPATGNYFLDYARANSYDYTKSTRGEEVGGKDPQHLDRVNGGFLVNWSGTGSPDGQTTHENVFGGPGEWTKMAFYVKMNSAPGVADGVVKQWINGHMIRNSTHIPWHVAEADAGLGWNYFAIGGNDYFQGLPNSDLFEDWYAIDDLVVRSSMPDGKRDVAPNPPVDIDVQ